MYITITKEATYQNNWSPRWLQADDIGLKSPQRVSTTMFFIDKADESARGGGGGGVASHMQTTCKILPWQHIRHYKTHNENEICFVIYKSFNSLRLKAA